MYEYQALLVSIHDGDTGRYDIDCGFDIWRRNLDTRLNGIDCPELGRPDALGEKARDFVRAWFQQHAAPYVVNTVKDRSEKFGRLLISVKAPDRAELIADLLAAELARPYDGHGPRPWADPSP